LNPGSLLRLGIKDSPTLGVSSSSIPFLTVTPGPEHVGSHLLLLPSLAPPATPSDRPA
jgi:hypothetical protein